MKEMAGDEIKDSRGPLGPEYRVVRPCLRHADEAFIVEDLRYGAARRLVVVTEDRPEIRAAADRARRVVHDRIARLHRVETDSSGRLLLVEDWIEGETLAERVARLGPLHEAWILDALGEMAAALDRAHAAGIPHGHLGPESIVVDEDESPVLLGVAVDATCRGVGGAATTGPAAGPPTGPPTGPLTGAGPDANAGDEPSVASDVHAFAAIVFTALNGQPPSLHGGVDDAAALRGGDSEIMETPLRRALRRAALRGLDRDPARRPRSCGELMREVASAVENDAKDVETGGSDTSDERDRRTYDTPLSMLDLESEVADIVPRKARLVLKDQPAVTARWEKGEHFLSSGAVYKQLQQWQAAGETLELALAEFVGAIELDKGLVASRTRHDTVFSRLADVRWAEHPSAAEMRNRLRALLEGDDSAWATAWREGLLPDAETRLDEAEAILHEASHLNRAIASAEEWRGRWTEVSAGIPDRTLDLRWAEEIRDHRAACRRGEEAFERGRFATAGGCWAGRIDRLRVVLEHEAKAYEAAMDGRRRFDEAMSRAPRSRPVSRPVRASLDGLLAESDRIENDLAAVGDFEAAARLWSEAATGIGGLVQQDVERYGAMETARESYEKADASGRPSRKTWTRLDEEFGVVRQLAVAAGSAREAGDFDVAIARWTEARQRLERAFPADLERHREATLARERFDRRIDALPQRAIDRSVRADIERLRKRRGVLEDWLVAGRFTEVEDAVRRAIETIDKAMERDGRLHDDAVAARDRAVGVDIQFPEDVPQPVLDLLKPLFGEVDAAAVQARQAFELGEYADCTEAWNRTIALKEQATEDLRRETERFHRLRRRRAVLRTTGVAAAILLVLCTGAEFGVRWWFGGMRDAVATLTATSTGLSERRDDLLGRFDDVLGGPVVLLSVPGGLALRAEPEALATEIERSKVLRARLDAIPVLEVVDAWPAPLRDDIEAFSGSLATANRQWDAADLDELAAVIEPLASQGTALAARGERAAALRRSLDELPGRPADTGGFAEVDRGWDAFEGLVVGAEDAYERDDLDRTEVSIAEARALAEAMATMQARLAAEEARDAFEGYWTADVFQPLKKAALAADRDRVEVLASDAADHFQAEVFIDAREDWLEALILAQGIGDEQGGGFRRYEQSRRAWEDRELPTPFVRDDAKFKASFNRAEETAQRGIDLGGDSDFTEGASELDKALGLWNRQLAAVDRHTREQWALLGNDAEPSSDRLKAAEWLAEALEPGAEAQINAAFTRDRLVWQVDPPRHREVRSWPLAVGREIELQFVATSRNVVLGPLGQERRVMVTGFWVATNPIGSGDRMDFDAARRDATGLGRVSALAPDGGEVRPWTFRLPTESEWMRAAQADVIRHGGDLEWCRDRYEPEEWWMHLVREDPGGPMFGPDGVIRRGDLPNDRFSPDRPGGAQVRPVLSMVFVPEVIGPEELERRRDPRLAGIPDESIVGDTRTVELGDASIDFVPVTVRGKRLWVATTECTQAVWRAVMGDLPPQPLEGSDLPVVGVTEMAISDGFLRQVRIDHDLKLRLPSAEEWRSFAAAGTPDPFCFGAEFPERHLPDFGWYALNAGGRARPVAGLRPNRWGLFDVHGNVAERCAIDRSKMTEVRGGAFNSSANQCRLDVGDRILSAQLFDWLGFRLVADELPAGK